MKRGYVVARQAAFSGLLQLQYSDSIYFGLKNVMKMKGIEGAPVNWLVMALSQSMEPWKPSKCWASLLCFS